MPTPRILSLCLAAVCTVTRPAATVAAQTGPADQREVVAAVQTLFDAMATCDAAAARAVSLPEGRLYRVQPGAAADPRSSTFEEFNTQLAGCTRRMLERMWTPQVRVHKGIASLWAPYDFWLDGAFSHCGIDSFDLVKTADGWKITGGIYTVEREGCTPSPLGPPTFPKREAR